MDNISAYNAWSAIYDTNVNRTRDLEAVALRKTLENRPLGRVLEIGCGTGKNTAWYAERADEVLGLDFSEEMLAKAKSKIQAEHVSFRQQDVREDWHLPYGYYDLLSFSLVLEHIEDLNSIFAKARDVLKKDGMLYLGELHPFKQYLGTKARFDASGQGEPLVLECFTHHVSDYFQAASRYGFNCVDLGEWFDDSDDADGSGKPPRILSLLFRGG